MEPTDDNLPRAIIGPDGDGKFWLAENLVFCLVAHENNDPRDVPLILQRLASGTTPRFPKGILGQRAGCEA